MAALCVAVMAVAAVTGCSGSGSPEGTGVGVVERDFHISVPGRVQPGKVLIDVHNRGPDMHELIVVRREGRLPLRRDGMTVDEEALQHENVGHLEPAEPGARRLALTLRPGRYQIFCNMSGHYLGGMHAELVVS